MHSGSCSRKIGTLSPLSRMIESELKSHLTLVTGVYSAISVTLVVDFALPQVTS